MLVRFGTPFALNFKGFFALFLLVMMKGWGLRAVFQKQQSKVKRLFCGLSFFGYDACVKKCVNLCH